MDHSAYIRKTPDADTVVLMLHGIMGTPRHFDGFLPIIPPQWDIFNLLLPGHGAALRDFNRSSMAAWREFVQEQFCILSERYDRIYVIAHSMGTLLSMEAAQLYPDKIKGMIVLAPPLRIRVKPVMTKYSAKIVFNKVDPEDPRELAVAKANSVAADRRVWRYAGSLPRMLELLKLSRQCRSLDIRVPCMAFLSEKDELVSPKSTRYFSGDPRVRCFALPGSGHFYYAPQDWETMLSQVQAFLTE